MLLAAMFNCKEYLFKENLKCFSLGPVQRSQRTWPQEVNEKMPALFDGNVKHLLPQNFVIKKIKF